MMQKHKTQNSVSALSGIEGIINFEQSPSNPFLNFFQLPPLRDYRIDRDLLFSAIQVKHG